MPITAELSAEIGRRLRKSRDELVAMVRARTDSPGGDPPQISPRAHQVLGDDSPEAEMISHDQEHFADHETALLHDIDVALGRLESGGYGICVECGNEIPAARLLATPTVQTCIECQRRIEKDQHVGRGGPTM
ncbi:MAG: TraR/DksA family transcriptional regulator [Massilia sp.]